MVMQSLPIPVTFEERCQAELPSERRSANREVVRCPAVLRTPFATISGEMSDLSTGGARFEAPNVPGPAVNAFLEWEGREVFCRVIWSKHDACGVAFDRPLAITDVGETAEQWKPVEPPAAIGNIQMGAKRNRFRLATSGDAEA